MDMRDILNEKPEGVIVLRTYEEPDPTALERIVELRQKILVGAHSFADALMGPQGMQVTESVRDLCEALDACSRQIAFLEGQRDIAGMAEKSARGIEQMLKENGVASSPQELLAAIQAAESKKPKPA